VRRRAEPIAWGLAALAFAAIVAGVFMNVATGSSIAETVEDAADVGLVFSICFPVLGAFVVRRRGSHLVGWLMSGIGTSIALHSLADTWSRIALVDEPGSLPWGSFASWVTGWLWLPGWVLATTLLLVVFPDGRPRGRRLVLAWVDGIGVAAVTAAFAAVSWPLRGPDLLVEPEQIEPDLASAHAALEQIYAAGLVVILLLTVASLGSLVARYRGADADVRRQIAWVVYGVAIAVVLSAIGANPAVGGFVQVLEAVALVGGIAVAMFRYRLYDIEVVVNRTLVYGALTATLGGAYLASVLLLQLVLSPSSDLAIAGSTLAVAALFRPARSRIQTFVDRRFYRRRYDAVRTIERFGTYLRDEVDLDAVSAELRGVITETMQPAHVSVWLREASR
jgi:phage tail protein X